MRRLLIQPNGWPCILGECPPGFFVHNNFLCLKTDYGDSLLENGEAFWGGEVSDDSRNELIVQPCVAQWEEG